MHLACITYQYMFIHIAFSLTTCIVYLSGVTYLGDQENLEACVQSTSYDTTGNSTIEKRVPVITRGTQLLRSRMSENV